MYCTYSTFKWKHIESKIQAYDAQIKGQGQRYSCGDPFSPGWSTENVGRYEVGIKLSPQGKGMEKKMVTHSSIFAWKIPWTEEPGGLQSKGSQRVRMTEQLNKKGKRERGTQGRN